ncbi:hypothetical protein V7S43_007129 [Phytophthora oleae]|uniref:Uncharacterized protein n=1 Tax=Phytophthora oleae TaxID=2107226 RepID=A0ABD3FKZ3_9STRA
MLTYMLTLITLGFNEVLANSAQRKLNVLWCFHKKGYDLLSNKTNTEWTPAWKKLYSRGNELLPQKTRLQIKSSTIAREVLRLREHYPDTNWVMCYAMRELVASEEAFAKARRVVEQADRNCEQALTDDRDRRLESHRQNYKVLKGEVEDEIRFGGEQKDGYFAPFQAVLSGKESSGDDDDGSEFEGPAEAPSPSRMPHTRSRGSVSPLSVSDDAEYAGSLQQSEAEKTEEASDPDAGESRPDN